MSSHKACSYTHQSGDNLLNLLRIFLDTHHLRLEQLASLLRVSPLTLQEWFDDGAAPPAACLALSVLFDTRRQMSGRTG